VPNSDLPVAFMGKRAASGTDGFSFAGKMKTVKTLPNSQRLAMAGLIDGPGRPAELCRWKAELLNRPPVRLGLSARP